MDQNRDGFIDKNDLRDTFAALGEMFTLLFLSINWINAQVVRISIF